LRRIVESIGLAGNRPIGMIHSSFFCLSRFFAGNLAVLAGIRLATACRCVNHVDTVVQNSSCCKRSRMVQQRSPARLGTTLALTNASQQVFSGGVEDFESQNSVWVPLQGAPREDVMKRNLITILSLVVMSLLLNATGAYALL
jgi:hypothetical protein